MIKVKSIHEDRSNMKDWSIVAFNPFTGKVSGYLPPKEETIGKYRDNWEFMYPESYGIIGMTYRDILALAAEKEKKGGKYYVKSPYLKSKQVDIEDFKYITGGEELRCD